MDVGMELLYSVSVAVLVSISVPQYLYTDVCMMYHNQYLFLHACSPPNVS